MLKDELENDPLSIGYSSMTDNQVKDSLNSKTVTGRINALTSAELFDEFDPLEWDLIKKDAEKSSEIDRILNLSNPIIGKNTSIAFKGVLDVFGDLSKTVANLKQARKITITRAAELGIAKVKTYHVTEARS